MQEFGTAVAKSLDQFPPVLLTLDEAVIAWTLPGDLAAPDLVQQTLLKAQERQRAVCFKVRRRPPRNTPHAPNTAEKYVGSIVGIMTIAGGLVRPCGR